MTTYLVQYRVVRLPDASAKPDAWSSATSTMTVVEGSAPLQAEDDARAVVEAVGRLAPLAAQLAVIHQARG